MSYVITLKNPIGDDWFETKLCREDNVAAFEQRIRVERLSWFINLRWGAVAGGLVIVLVAPLLVPVNIHYGPLALCVGVLGLLNAVYWAYWEKVKSKGLPTALLAQKGEPLFHFQMAADLLLLTLMLHFTGGVQNPLLLFYLFHLAISTTVLPARQSLLYSTLALLLPWFLFVLERLGFTDQNLWQGISGLTPLHEQALLGAYSVTAAGLWFFLSRLALDNLTKERELLEAGDKLRAANEELNQLDMYKSHFLKHVVFQLKKPAIDIDFDLSEVEKSLPKKSEKALTSIQAAKKRVWALLELIEDLVWLSRMEDKDIPLKKEWIDVYETLLKRVQAMEGEAEKKGIVFQLHGDPQVRLRADLGAFERVADNLFSNAVKYTLPGKTHVVVEFQVMGDWLVLSVEDEGIGIPPKQQQKIFDEFFRATNAKTVEKFGTGLGLSIVKRVMDSHGGKVNFVSTNKQGTKVETWWPALLVDKV